MRRAVRLALPLVLLAGLAASGCGGDTAGGPSDLTPAGKVVRIDGRATTVSLDLQTVGALADNGVLLGVGKPATAKGGVARFPITGGSVSSTTIQGPIVHGGAIVFTKGGKQADLTNLVINTRTGVMTAVLDGVRYPLARVLGSRSPAKPEDSSRLELTGLPLLLAPQAARALNERLGTSVFEALQPLGEATVRATPVA
jgi:hypothetical protein